MPHRTLSADEAAQYLNLPRADLDRLADDEQIPFEKRGDRRIFRRRELDAWASQRILGSSPQHLAEYHRRSSARAKAVLPDPALLPGLIQPDQIDPALTARTKPSVLRDMVEVATRTGWVFDPAELTQSLEAREALCSTAVPGGLAFLHPRAQQPYRFERSFLVLGRAIQPIYFGAPDREPTDLFFLLCCQDDPFHLHTLARLCFLAVETDLILQLRQAPNATAMSDCLLAAEAEILGYRPTL